MYRGELIDESGGDTAPIVVKKVGVVLPPCRSIVDYNCYDQAYCKLVVLLNCPCHELEAQ